MKQYFSKQLMMLAILLFAGVGSVSAGTADVTVTWNHNDVVSVYFLEIGTDNRVNAISGETIGLNNRKNYQLFIEGLNGSYKVTSLIDEIVDGESFDMAYNYNKDGCITFGTDALGDDHIISIQIDEIQKHTISVSRNPDLVRVNIYKVAANGGWDPLPSKSDTQTSVEWEVEADIDYVLQVQVPNWMTYQLSSIMVGGLERLEEYWENGGHLVLNSIEEDQSVSVSVAKYSEETKVITANLDDFSYEGGEKGSLLFYRPWDEYSPVRAISNTTEFQKNETIWMKVEENVGWQVSSVTLDGADATNDYLTNGYLDFSSSDNHTVNVQFSEATTHKITANINMGGLYVNGRVVGPIGPDEDPAELSFNEGTNVTMNFAYSLQVIVDNVKKLYVVTSVKIDNVEKLSALEKAENNFIYKFDGLMADHSVNIVYSEVQSTNTIKAVYTDDAGRACFNDDWFGSGEDCLFTSGTNVVMKISRNNWSANNKYEVTSISYTLEGGSTVQLSLDGHLDENGYYYQYTLPDLTTDVIVNVTQVKIEQYTIKRSYEEEGRAWVNLRDETAGSYRSIAPGESLVYDGGSNVTMFVPYIVNNDGTDYKVTLTVDNNVIPTTAVNEQNEYVIDFGGSISANHIVSLTYTPVTYHYITVNYQGYAMNVYLNGGYAAPTWRQQFEEGSNVTMILNMEPGYSIQNITKTIGEGEPEEITYNNGYTFENLTEDIEVTVTSEDNITTYSIGVGIIHGTVCFESALTGKIERNGGYDFNEGSDVTMTIKPAFGYELESIMEDENDVTAAYQANGNKLVFNNLQGNHYLSVTMRKKSDQTSVSFTLDASGEAAICSEYDLDFSNVQGITAYVAYGFNSETGKVMMMKVTEAQAGTGLYIKGTPGTYQIPVKTTSLYYSNMMKPVTEDMIIDNSECNSECYFNYLLTAGKFNRSRNTSLSAGKAYLQVLQEVSSDELESISIETVDTGDMNGDKKVTITDAVLILDQILTTPKQ